MSLNCHSVIVLTQIILILVFNSVIESKVPKFCDQKTFDSVFNGLKNRTFFVKNEWIWTYDQNQKNMSAPVRQDPKEKFRLKDMAFISDVPHCQTSSNISCADIESVKDLVILFYRRPKKWFSGDYQVKRIADGVVTVINGSNTLPLGLKLSGNVFSSEEKFWPKVISEETQRLDKRHTTIAFNPINKELILLSKGQYKGWLCINKFTHSWKCQTVSNKWLFVGAFSLSGNLYVLAIKDSENRLFTFTEDQEVVDTSISIQSYFGCGLKGQTFMADTPEDIESDSDIESNSSWIWVIVVVSIVCLVVVFALIAVFSLRSGVESEASKEGEEVKPKNKFKAKPKPLPKLRDDKGKEVNRSKIGVRDTKVNWSIKLSTPSMGTEGKDRKTNANNKKTKI